MGAWRIGRSQRPSVDRGAPSAERLIRIADLARRYGVNITDRPTNIRYIGAKGTQWTVDQPARTTPISVEVTVFHISDEVTAVHFALKEHI